MKSKNSNTQLKVSGKKTKRKKFRQNWMLSLVYLGVKKKKLFIVFLLLETVEEEKKIGKDETKTIKKD